ncbi:hypothetical protein ZHAS_00021778 [Anopheles sinensis]|uniref:Uncharacterized protein n=1 Tax=Anopheles sinensis TaxID=74873 RepID=A0A084WTK3_ANOSI|nr:hypothetical protein ZHAS_00021778 [Anopheles sinensis]
MDSPIEDRANGSLPDVVIWGYGGNLRCTTYNGFAKTQGEPVRCDESRRHPAVGNTNYRFGKQFELLPPRNGPLFGRRMTRLIRRETYRPPDVSAGQTLIRKSIMRDST